MIDRYLDGQVERISPEAPVPVLHLGGEENRLGGAANVALNLAALGAKPLLVGVVGADENGTTLRSLLQERHLTDSFVLTDPSRPTTVKTRLTASGQQLMRVDREVTLDLEAPMVAEVIASFKKALDDRTVDLVLFQDYNKGVLHPGLTERLLAICLEAKVPSVVDPKKGGFWSFGGATLFKPNLREIQQQVDFPISPDVESLDRAAAEIFSRMHCSQVMITLSEHGIYVHNGQSSTIFATNARDVADVSGAGDTVISVAACGLAAGLPIEEIARLSNLAGAQVIAKRGVVAIDLQRLLADAKEG